MSAEIWATRTVEDSSPPHIVGEPGRVRLWRPGGDLPHVSVGEGGGRTVGTSRDRLPIGIHLRRPRRGRLRRRRPMAGRVPSVPRTSRRAAPGTARMDAPDRRACRSSRTLPSAPKKVVWNQLLTPVKTETIDELRLYFGAGSRTPPTPSRSDDLDERSIVARDAFSCASIQGTV